ncbi:serine hydrolase domain-containing protein [Fodinicola acaciae]|uniref:serine hydrolase domain-containing protein n=1 Tax=Fodinicola acaciae TaxID=2681555 RepID=UPI0013D245E0|nr:serine hydrolase domain-containing protein [Fodinicola acaciae]
MLKEIAVAAVLSLVPASAPPQLPPLNDAVLRKAIAIQPTDRVTGVQLRITGTAGHWSGTSGVGDVRTGAPVPANGRFRIGSISKVFTAAVVLQLAAEHKVDVGQTVQHYLPGLLPDNIAPVTVGQLLDHTSGLPNDDSPYETTGDAAWFVQHRFDSWTPAQIIAIDTRHPMRFTPGTKQQYAGINYYLAGLLIEKITGDTYAHAVQARIITPLGLRDTSVPGMNDPRIPGPHSHGYVEVKGKLVDITEQIPWPWAEGGMISSAADLDRFLGALFTGRVVPASELDRMFTLPDVPYADNTNCPGGRACFSMGLMKATLPGTDLFAWGKTGSRPGYTSGFFATRGLERRAVYVLNSTGNKDGSDMPFVLRIASATFLGK